MTERVLSCCFNFYVCLQDTAFLCRESPFIGCGISCCWEFLANIGQNWDRRSASSHSTPSRSPSPQAKQSEANHTPQPPFLTGKPILQAQVPPLKQPSFEFTRWFLGMQCKANYFRFWLWNLFLVGSYMQTVDLHRSKLSSEFSVMEE